MTLDWVLFWRPECVLVLVSGAFLCQSRGFRWVCRHWYPQLTGWLLDSGCHLHFGTLTKKEISSNAEVCTCVTHWPSPPPPIDMRVNFVLRMFAMTLLLFSPSQGERGILAISCNSKHVCKHGHCSSYWHEWKFSPHFLKHLPKSPPRSSDSGG